MIGYWDQEAVDKTPNTYNLTPKNIKKIKVLDWDRLKKMTWYNQAMSKPCWCQTIGCEQFGAKDDEDSFWIGFYENGKVDCSFSACGGMCHYKFSKFYDRGTIENKYDFWVQVNSLRWLNGLISEGIISAP